MSSMRQNASRVWERCDIFTKSAEYLSKAIHTKWVKYGHCDQVSVWIGKVAGVFSKLGKLWKSKKISFPVKTRLYEALVLSTLLNSAELWPVSVTQMKKKTRSSTPQMATKYPGDFLEGQSNKWESLRGNCTFKAGRHYQMQTSEMCWTSFTNGSP